MNQHKTGEFLKYLRKDKGLTQEQLAEHSMFHHEQYLDGKQVAICQI